MTNPYREHMDRIQAEVKQVSRQFIEMTAYELDRQEDKVYGQNFAIISGGGPFDEELDKRVKAIMKEATGDDSDYQDL